MLKTPLDFEYVGCFQSDARLICHGKQTSFQIKMNIEAPLLRENLIPEEINSIKYLEPDDFLDVTARRDEKYTDDGAGEKLETILQFIEKMDSNERNLRERIGSDIVCNRGLLVRLGYLPKLKFRAVRRKDVIFMCYTSKIDTVREKSHSHSSLKFEKKITDDSQFLKSSRNLKYLRTGLRRKVVHRVMFPDFNVFSSAEIDARHRDGNNVEIKMVRNKRDDGWTKMCSEKTFLQCYLANIEYLLFGSSKRKPGYPYRIVIEDIEMIHRDDIVQDFSGIEECIDRLCSKLTKLTYLLRENNTAITVEQNNRDDFEYEYIDADDCEFVPEEFLRNFE